ncbi:YbdD/YjiX family protein [Streptomyces sodiiphilus]|uniref:YbdD/YjiX family protein n=1 Tax=Streptomyces sodiiphilus TaxID=226217 RepID=A0ABN2NSP0_9ACTN
MTALRRGLRRVRRGIRWVWWYLTELTGENAYHRHVERVRRADPGAPVPGRGEFERCRMDARDRDPGGGARCC